MENEIKENETNGNRCLGNVLMKKLEEIEKKIDGLYGVLNVYSDEDMFRFGRELTRTISTNTKFGA